MKSHDEVVDDVSRLWTRYRLKENGFEAKSEPVGLAGGGVVVGMESRSY